MEILCFFAGIAFVYVNYTYPLIFLCIVLFIRPRLTIVLWFLAAIVWGVCHNYWVADKDMPKEGVLKNALIEGYVSSIPTYTDQKTQFQFYADKLDGKAVGATLLLSCYKDCPVVRAGEHWKLVAKLKQPRNLANHGGFDYVSWVGARHITWTGYIKRNAFQRLETQSNPYPLLSLRNRLADMLANLDKDEQTLGIIQALTLGVTTHIDKGEWELFRRTGTIHLMVISGAHIGLVAGLTFGSIYWMWCRFGRLCLYYPAPKVASISAILMALIYALLAGFAVPAQRSLIVCFFMLIRNFLSQRFSVWQAWRYALLGVLLFEPHSVLMSGFYLSFIAVAILIVINQRFPGKGFKKTITLQLACLAGLMPLTLFWFSYGAVNGLVANLVAIPLVGFVIVPLALGTTFVSQWMAIPWVVVILKFSISSLMYYLSWIDSFAVLNLNFAFTKFLSPLALMLAMCVALFLPSTRLLPTALILAIAGVFPSFEKVKNNEAIVDVLDVGQGLAVSVRTANHILLYDTGIKFYQGSDMGKLAIIPYLETLGIKTIDKVIISHPDLDHRGGLSSIEAKFNVHELVVDNPKFYKRGIPCHTYKPWTWDGVSFRFLPIKKRLKSKNNNSCILQVSTAGGQVLLSGDIEKLAENYLVQTYGQELKSSVMLIPHHGSKTSSSASFLEHISPQYAVVSYGFDNRYRFPHIIAINEYKRQNIPVFNTMDCGMIRVVLTSEQTKSPSCFR